MKTLNAFATFLRARLGNLVTDLTEIEGALATVTTLGGTLAALASGNSQAERLVGAGLAAVSVVTLLIHKALTAINAAGG